MSDTKMLTADQALIVRNLETALENFRQTDLLDSAGLSKALGAIDAIKVRLSEAFPELYKAADFYYFDEFAEAPVLNEDNYENSLFDLMLSLISLHQAGTFDQFTAPLSNLSNELFDLMTYSREFDSERGHWKG